MTALASKGVPSENFTPYTFGKKYYPEFVGIGLFFVLLTVSGVASVDVAGGLEAMKTRRVGRNELAAIEVVLAYCDAQREYAGVDRNGIPGGWVIAPNRSDSLFLRTDYNLDFGARPIKRAIQHMVADPLAMAFLEGRFHDGDVIVVTNGATLNVTNLAFDLTSLTYAGSPIKIVATSAFEKPITRNVANSRLRSASEMRALL